MSQSWFYLILETAIRKSKAVIQILTTKSKIALIPIIGSAITIVGITGNILFSIFDANSKIILTPFIGSVMTIAGKGGNASLSTFDANSKIYFATYKSKIVFVLGNAEINLND